MLLRVLFFLLSACFPSLEILAFRSLGTAAIRTRARSTHRTATSLGAVTQKRTLPADVKSIFDDFAERFEELLVDSLEYSAPRHVAEAASQRIQDHRDGRKYASVIDAGCGTGLTGPFLRGIVDGPMVGVDLSPKMVELAALLIVDDGPTPMAKDRMRRSDELARNAQGIHRLYDGVFIGDLLDLGGAKPLEGYGHDVKTFPTKPIDLIVSADVLCYFGDTSEVLRAFADRLALGGDLIFSTETIANGDYNWIQTVSDRYAHDKDHIHRMAAEAGLTKVSQVAFTPRLEQGEKVLGVLHTFTKQ